MKWYNPQNAPFSISGFPFYETDHVYRRLPLRPSHEIPEPVDGLANETAGGQIRFHAKLKTLRIQVSLGAKPQYYAELQERYGHMTLVGQSAFDVYVSKDGGEYVFAGLNGMLAPKDRFYDKRLINLSEPAEMDILLNFPLYSSVDKILIGVDDDAEISEPQKKFADDRKILVYGTSIEQGGCASRPGTADVNILSRWLNREVYDLGFSSNGKAEPEMAHILSQIENVAALVITVENNCPSTEWLDEKLREFIKIYREKHPETLIILMPGDVGAQDLVDPEKLAIRMHRKAVQQKIVDDFKTAGDQNIELLCWTDHVPMDVDGHSILSEYTVDGAHYTDLGFFLRAKVLYQRLKGYFDTDK